MRFPLSEPEGIKNASKESVTHSDSGLLENLFSDSRSSSILPYSAAVKVVSGLGTIPSKVGRWKAGPSSVKDLNLIHQVSLF